MDEPIQFKITPSPVRNSVNRSRLWGGYIFVALALACFTFSPRARAVTPAPDGGYPGDNTAEGNSALFSNTSGSDNTAIGFQSLFSNTTGGFTLLNAWSGNNLDGHPAVWIGNGQSVDATATGAKGAANEATAMFFVSRTVTLTVFHARITGVTTSSTPAKDSVF